MRSARLSGVYLLLVALTGLQLALFTLLGVIEHVSMRGTLFMMFLLVGLALRSRLAWRALVLVNAIPVLALPLAIVGSGDVLWGHVALSFLTGLALEATLLSAAMRRFTGGQVQRLTALPL